jgi:hypothetical protein
LTRTASRGWQTLGAGAAYLALSFAYFAIPVLPRFGSDEIGLGGDPQIFVWYLEWWPHAILHGHDPFVTHAIWAPSGTNLAWSTSVPGLALLLAPVTLAAGPVAAYNVAAVALPAFAATTAFLLCRHLTRSLWPSLAGGYLFGFSSYMLGHELGHLHLTAVFLVPLAALFVLQFVEGGVGRDGLAWRLIPLLVLQLSFSTEVFFTMAAALVVSLVVAALTVPASRSRLRAAIAPLLGAYAACAVVAAPLLYFAFSDYQGVITPTGNNLADFVTFAFPAQLTALGGSLAPHFDPRLGSPSSEVGQYLGLPALAVVTWYAVRGVRRPGGRFLLVVLGVAGLLTLGTPLFVRGHELFPLPWALLRKAPLFDNVIPGRLALYVSLVSGVIVALWAAAPAVSRTWRIVLTVAAIAAIVPHLGVGYWHERPLRPAFFADKLYRDCLRPEDTVLAFPVDNQPLLWQAESGFAFRLANVGLSDAVPAGLPQRRTILALFSNDPPVGGGRALVAAARSEGIAAILLDPQAGAKWLPLLAPRLHGRLVGGIEVYRVTPGPASCGHA